MAVVRLVFAEIEAKIIAQCAPDRFYIERVHQRC